MSSRTFTIEPLENSHPDTVVFFPLPLRADIENTGDRLRSVAAHLGVTIFAMDVFGQQSGRLRGIDARFALQPGNHFRDTCLWTADDIRAKLEPFGSRRIGVGHSVGAVSIASMQHYVRQDSGASLFAGMEIADGFNLQASPRTSRGFARYLRYQLLDALHDRTKMLRSHLIKQDAELDFPFTTQATLTDRPEAALDPDEKPLATWRIVRNLESLMRSDLSTQSAMLAAGDSQLPLHVVGFTRGISGKQESLQYFMQLLRSMRSDEAEAPLEASIQSGWHSKLLNPRVLVPNLRETLELTNGQRH